MWPKGRPRRWSECRAPLLSPLYCHGLRHAAFSSAVHLARARRRQSGFEPRCPREEKQRRDQNQNFIRNVLDMRDTLCNMKTN